ncbi:MAG: DNA repair protein RadC [Candidatus Omnitrophica bacterium]|nr:DNA repair protein RadC [Candidatus Omnitrophota bacterium]MDD5553757.1 DNA repair protein RadC [Candidatus Omnitrophota bacterium]
MKEIRLYKSSIKNWPREDRPRERLFKNGEHTLSDSELLAVILGTGTRGKTAVDLARALLRKFADFRNMSHTDMSQWKGFKGLGQAKIAKIKAALEISRRCAESKTRRFRPKIRSSHDAAKMLMPRMRDLKKEVFKILMLNSQNRLIDAAEIEQGTVNQANPIIREAFQKALENFSAFIICAHNHPSGDPAPSPEDKEFTRSLIQSGKILSIELLDHIIIGDSEYFSFADEGLMEDAG